MITKEPPKIRKRLRKAILTESLCRLRDPVGRWWHHLSEQRERLKVARYRLGQELYGPPKENLPAVPINRVALHFEKLKGITPQIAISPVFPDPYGRTGTISSNPPPALQSVQPIVATSGSTVTPDVTPVTGNAIDMPTGYSELIIYVGDLGIAKEKATLYVKVGSASVQAVEVLSWGAYCLQGVSGKRVAFGAATMNRNSNTLTNGTLPLNLLATIGQSQVAPSGQTGTINLDRCPPNLYSPARACIVFDGEFQRFQIAPAPIKRDIFIIESDAGANLTPVRHVHIPENQTEVVECRYQFVCIASIDTATLSVTTPAGAILATDAGIAWEPSFTVEKTITVSTASAFKTAVNDASDNVEILLTAGVYDLQALSANWMTPTNYGTGMGKNRLIRTASGTNDVTFRVATPTSQGGQWHVVLFKAATAITWIFKNLTWDFAGIIKYSAGGTPKGCVDVALWNSSACHFVNCSASGQYVSENADPTNGLNTTIKVRCVTGTSVCYSLNCTFRNGTDDLTAANVEGGTAITFHQINNYLDGNGSRTDSQIVTNHGGGAVVCWGCSFGNLSNGNVTQIASDGESSPTYLMFCRAYVANFVTNIGISVPGNGTANPSFMHFCNFQAAQVFDAIKSVVCSTIKTYKTGRPLAYIGSTITAPKWIGSDIYGAPSGGSDILLDAGSTQINVIGCRLTHYSETASQGLIRLLNFGSGGSTLTATNVILRTLAATTSQRSPWVNMGSDAVANIKNILALAPNASNGVTQTIAGTTSSATSNRIQTASKPGTWDTVFATANTGNTFSLTAPGLDAYDMPVAAGNVITAGTTGIVGSVDIYGRPWLGGSWPQGAAETTAVRSNGFLYPMVWVSA